MLWSFTSVVDAPVAAVATGDCECEQCSLAGVKDTYKIDSAQTELAIIAWRCSLGAMLDAESFTEISAKISSGQAEYRQRR